MKVTLTWTSASGLRLRVYNPSSKLTEIDPSTKTETWTTSNLIPGIWKMAAYSEARSGSIQYTITVTITY
jgi:hypothetical protein